MNALPRMVTSIGMACCVLFMCSGCGVLRPSNDDPEADAAAPSMVLPTLTPTEIVEVVPTAQGDALAAILPTVTESGGNVDSDSDTTVDAPDTSTTTRSPAVVLLPTVTPTSARPELVVSALSVNVRNGPGTVYDVVALVEQGERFSVTGRNEASDWWQVCCVDGESGWLYDPLVTVQNVEGIAVALDIPPTPAPIATEPAPPQPTQASEPATQEVDVVSVEPDTTANASTAGDFNPDAQYQIVQYRVLGFDDNNGGIFNKGGQQLIFVTVLDENGNGVNGAVVKDAVGDKLNVSVGSKGPGRAEIKMDWDPYKLYVATDGSGPVTSQVSNQMNNPYPHIPDVIGLLGPVDNEYAICPTADDRCEPPFYHAHWSYEIVFQKVK